MKFRKLMLAGGALAALAAAPAQASIVDNPQFRVLGLVIVWGADADGAAPRVSDFVIDDVDGAGDSDLIAGDVNTVVTGTLTPTADSFGGATTIVDGDGNVLQSSDGVLDATDSFNAFTLDGDTSLAVAGTVQESSFFVASNTAFNIDADISEIVEEGFTLADVGYELSVTQTGTEGIGFGSAAQFPGGSATGGVATAATLQAVSDLTVPIFEGTQRTAAAAGSISEQSVRFDSVYTLGGDDGYDLSQGAGNVSARVTYTVFVP